MKGANLEPVCLWTAMNYISRVREAGTYKINRETFCILFATCLMLAMKFLHDQPLGLNFWAGLSGFDVASIANAERLVLQSLKWRLFVDPKMHDALIQSALCDSSVDVVASFVAATVLA